MGDYCSSFVWYIMVTPYSSSGKALLINILLKQQQNIWYVIYSLNKPTDSAREGTDICTEGWKILKLRGTMQFALIF